MSRFRPLVFLLIILPVLIFPFPALGGSAPGESKKKQDEDTYQEPTSENVEAVADQLEFLKNEKKIIGRGNVVITYKDIKMTCDYAEIETESKRAYGKGHVIVMRGENVIAAKGEEVTYDFEKGQGSFPNGQSVEWPWFTKGRVVEQLERGKYKIEDAVVTTCDLRRPHYEIRSKHATVHTGDKIVGRDVSLYILGRKVFWWPYVVIPLNRPAESPIQIQPGYSSKYGGYVLTSKSFSVTEWLSGAWHADWRSKRGFGGGADFNYHFEKIKTDGLLNLYWTQDKRAPTPGLENPYSERERRDRGRITFKQRTDFSPHSYALLRYHRLDDEFFLQDFFQKEFRSDVEPTSFAHLAMNSEKHGLYIFNQKRTNKFGEITERLPEIKFDWKNAPFFKSEKIYYENQVSFSNLHQVYTRMPHDEDTVRGDTFHEWSMPLKWKEIKFTPAVNFRETIYSRDHEDSGARARTALGGSADLRTQFYKMFNATTDFMGIEINQLRHVFEPSIRYDTLYNSNVSNEELFEFDSVDAIDDANRVTFGIENRIQTKRMIRGKMRRVDVVSLNTFLSYDFHPDLEYSRSGFATLINDLVLRPYSWLQFEIRSDYDMNSDKFREFTQDLIIRKDRFHILFGHRLVSDRKFINAPGNNQFVFDAGYWINDLWMVGGHVRFDQRNHELEEWQISATRDLHDFLLDFGYNVRTSDIDESNKELFFLFRLKAFPAYPLKSGNRASFSEPRIGPTVAGSHTAPGSSQSIER